MRKFKTESKKLLDLMINSIYTNREIFLRELVSNASDAVDKLYFRSLTDKSVQLGKEDLEIRVAYDKEAGTITVSDSGIGMTAEELEKNLGVIAHSGSQEFKAENDFSETDAADIIGQFGVGFYSSFMVAKKVKVITRPYGSDEVSIWESNGIDGYTITAGTDADKPGHGTDVILTVKDDTDDDKFSDFVSEWKLHNLIKQYSNYVRYPIHMTVTKTRELPKPEDADEDYRPQYEEYTEDEIVNSMIPIWKRRKSDVTDEEYAEFYKSDFHDFTDPVRTITVHAEGALSYDALLFIPGRAPMDLYSRAFEKGLALYSSGVLIMDKCADMLPDYFGFVRGVVDSSDLSLNISRETLQRNSQLRAIAKKVEKKILSELKKMRDNDREDYELFWDNFGRSIKFGIYAAYGMKNEDLGQLLMYYSVKQQKYVTLDEYVESMPEDQVDIYYAAGDDLERLRNQPIVRTFTRKGFDVLLCTEDVDEFCLQTVHEWKDKKLKNVSTADIDLASDDEKKIAEEANEANKELLDAMKEILGDNVAAVQVSPNPTESPATLVTAGPMSLEMERILANVPEEQRMRAFRILQLNAQHPVFKKLVAAQADGKKSKLHLYTDLLYNQALLTCGLPIEDPITFAEEICKLM